jgi:hypothetical protein
VNIDYFTARNVKGGRTVITIGIDADEIRALRTCDASALTNMNFGKVDTP